MNFADHLCLLDRLVVVLDPADLGFVAGLALVELKLVDLGRLVPVGSDLDLAIHFANFAGLVIGLVLADLLVDLGLIDPVQMEIDLVRPSRPLVLTVLGFGLGLVQFRLEADQFRFLYLLDLFRHLVP